MFNTKYNKLINQINRMINTYQRAIRNLNWSIHGHVMNSLKANKESKKVYMEAEMKCVKDKEILEIQIETLKEVRDY